MIVLPLNVEININNFEEKIYFFDRYYTIAKNKKLFIYNIFGLTKDKIVYFYNTNRIEVCDKAEGSCKDANNFYKFEANKNYSINVYSYDNIFKKYVFGVFDKNIILLYKGTGLFINNEPNIYLISKDEFNPVIDEICAINFKSYSLLHKVEDYSSKNDLYEKLRDFNYDSFTRIIISEDELLTYKYKYFEIFVYPNFNYELKLFDQYILGIRKTIYETSYSSFQLKSNEDSFIKIHESLNHLNDDYNYIRIIKSEEKNIRLIDIENIS